MCGICGIVDRPGNPVDPALLARLNARLLHRGPDEGGQWIDDAAGIAMRRLAIIDLRSGQQPMFNEDGNVAIVFNGEIYNYHDLRAALIKQGHQFKTNSDTETVIHLYEQYGPEGLAQLNGMFALALWDRKQQRLMLARDRAGKKPLYYCQINGRMIYSSEMTSLLEHPGVSRELDRVALDNYFALGYVPAPHTIFENVRQLEPGHFLLWKGGAITTAPYWRLEPRAVKVRTEEEAAEELLELLKDAVRIRLYSDVPFGALLSGGVDSGLVVGLMSQLMDRKVKTFTIGFSERDLDESDFAAEVAQHFGTEHHHLLARPHSAIELLEKMTAHFGEPFADSSAIPTYLVSEMARQHVTMALSGDGGDEVFGGYNSYRYHTYGRAYRRVPKPLRSVARWSMNRVNGSLGSGPARIRRFMNEAELPMEQAWLHSRSIFADDELSRLYTPEFANNLDDGTRGWQVRAAFDRFRTSGSDGDILNYVDYETYLPGDILVKVDRMSMANSLEMRAPLLDYRVAEFAAGLPRSAKWTGKEGKRILKRVAASILPPSTIKRRKQGFVPPIAAWLRGELAPFARSIIHDSSAGKIVRLDYCEQLLDRHIRGEGGDLSRKVWSVLCYLLWHERFAAAHSSVAANS